MLNTETKIGLSICICALVTMEVRAQVKDSIIFQIEHSSVIDSRPNEPIRIFSMWIPFRISPIPERHEILFDAHVGNTWNPSGVLAYPDQSENYPEDPLADAYNPPYDQAPHRYQFYSADGVIRSRTISYTRKISAHGELYGSLTANMLAGGGSLMDNPVSDETIEDFHSILFNQDDPFRKRDHPLDRAEMKLKDRDGNTLEIKPDQIYFGMADIGYRHFTELVKRQKVLWTINTSVQAGIPMNRAREFISIGALLGTAFTAQLRKRYSLTVALGYAAQHDHVMRIRHKRFDFNYATGVTGYRFLISQNFDFKTYHRFTIGIEMQGMTAPLSTKERVVAPYLNPEDIGVQSSYSPEYWTTERPIAITNQRRAARSLIRGSEYLGINFSYRFGNSNTAPTLAFYLQEDWTVLYDTEGVVLPLFTISNNAQDFGVGFKLIQPIP